MLLEIHEGWKEPLRIVAVDALHGLHDSQAPPKHV